MKRMIALGCASLMAAAMAAPSVTAAPKQQVVEGSVALPTPYTDDTGCYAGIHRRQNAATQGNANGVVGYHFEVDKATWKKPFVLDVTAGQNNADLDIYFYLGPMTSVDDIVAAQGDPPAPPTISFNTRGPGGEADKVPDMAEYVIVCMYGGAQGAGAAAEFTYTAGKGVKLPKK